MLDSPNTPHAVDTPEAQSAMNGADFSKALISAATGMVLAFISIWLILVPQKAACESEHGSPCALIFQPEMAVEDAFGVTRMNELTRESVILQEHILKIPVQRDNEK